MTLTSLTALSPLDGRYADKLKCLRPLASEFSLIRFRFYVEIRWLIYLTDQSEISEAHKLSSTCREYLERLINEFRLEDAQRVKEIEREINHDVKAVEYFIQELFRNADLKEELVPLIPFIHFACTSEDINNIAYGLMLKSARDSSVVTSSMQSIMDQLRNLCEKYADTPMLSHTHGQAATPTTLGKEFANVVTRLDRQYNFFTSQSILAKVNGAVGNFNAHVISFPEIDWPVISKKFVESLGLKWNAYTTQIEPHDYLAEFFHTLIRFNTILIDCSQDIWSYISLGYFKQKPLTDEVGSSTMPHKINPIDFENAEGNLGIANALANHLSLKLPISRWQRDLTDSTVLRNISSVLGYTLVAYESLLTGLKKLTVDKDRMMSDLQSHPEVLGEALQTMMRRYGISDAYDRLKNLTRGKAITLDDLHQFVSTLSIPENAKKILKELQPDNYLGKAVFLAKNIQDNAP